MGFSLRASPVLVSKSSVLLSKNSSLALHLLSRTRTLSRNCKRVYIYIHGTYLSWDQTGLDRIAYYTSQRRGCGDLWVAERRTRSAETAGRDQWFGQLCAIERTSKKRQKNCHRVQSLHSRTFPFYLAQFYLHSARCTNRCEGVELSHEWHFRSKRIEISNSLFTQRRQNIFWGILNNAEGIIRELN